MYIPTPTLVGLQPVTHTQMLIARRIDKEERRAYRLGRLAGAASDRDFPSFAELDELTALVAPRVLSHKRARAILHRAHVAGALTALRVSGRPPETFSAVRDLVL
jgi:hypothetical protein